MSAAAQQARYTAHVVRHTRPGPQALAEYLATFRRHGGHAHPRQSVMAKRFGVSVRTIQRWLAHLAAAGVLVITGYPPQQHHITGRWRRRPNGYQCTFKKSRPPREPAKPQVEPTRQECRVIALFEELSSGSSSVPEAVVPPPWLTLGLTQTQWSRLYKEDEQ